MKFDSLKKEVEKLHSKSKSSFYDESLDDLTNELLTLSESLDQTKDLKEVIFLRVYVRIKSF